MSNWEGKGFDELIQCTLKLTLHKKMKCYVEDFFNPLTASVALI